MNTKQPTPQAISALLRKAGFTRALNSFAMRPEDAGFLVLGKVGPPGGLTVEHVSYRGTGHLAELNRYSAVLTSAGYRCEHSSTNSLVVTAQES